MDAYGDRVKEVLASLTDLRAIGECQALEGARVRPAGRQRPGAPSGIRPEITEIR